MDGSPLQRHDFVVLENLEGTEYGAGESPAEVREQLMKTSSRSMLSSPREYRSGEEILVAFDGSRPAAAAHCGYRLEELGGKVEQPNSGSGGAG